MFSTNDLEETLRIEVARTLRTNRPFVLLCIRAHRMKHGAMIEWQMKELNKALIEATREIDRTFFTASDEITVLLLETPLSVAVKIAQRLLRTVVNTTVLREITLQLSAGIAEFPSSANNAASLLKVARQAAEAAKQKGSENIEVAVAE